LKFEMINLIRLRREMHEEHCFRLHFITPGQESE
jgi:hypothetical protein